MTKQIDYTEALSQEDRDYLHARGQHDKVAAMDAEFGVETPEEELPPETQGMPMDVGSRRAWLAEQLRLLDEHDETGGGPVTVEDDYDNPSWTVKKLQAELNARELPTSGNRPELIERLRADDIEMAQATGEDDEMPDD